MLFRKKKYDESQIKKHPKRNRKQNKIVKDMIYHLDLIFGEYNTGKFLALILDCLDKMLSEETPSDHMDVRMIEIKFNDYYSVKYDCVKEEYVK